MEDEILRIDAREVLLPDNLDREKTLEPIYVHGGRRPPLWNPWASSHFSFDSACAMLEKQFGPAGKEALLFFEKMKLVETRWQTSDTQQPEKAYHTYYTSFHINASWPVYEISDVLAAAVMDEKEFTKIEKQIFDLVGPQGKFAGDVAEVPAIQAEVAAAQEAIGRLISDLEQAERRANPPTGAGAGTPTPDPPPVPHGSAGRLRNRHDE